MALTLFNRSLAPSFLDRREEAVQIAKDSLEVYRALGEKSPAGSRVRTNWAQAAINLGNRLAAVGRSQEALELRSKSSFSTES
jgi:hypothetical protein